MYVDERDDNMFICCSMKITSALTHNMFATDTGHMNFTSNV